MTTTPSPAGPRRALVVVDVQQEYFDGVLEIRYPPRDTSLANVVRVLDAAEQAGLPVVVVHHELPAGAPVFAAGSTGHRLHADLEARESSSWKRVTKSNSSVFAGTGLAGWLAEQGVDTVTLVGFMTNNCDLASAAGAEELGLGVEVLSDASGAIHLANELGKVPARQLHETLMVLLQSNFAAVGTTDEWLAAVASGSALVGSDLGTSAAQGAAAFA